jgi:hypothetical protein
MDLQVVETQSYLALGSFQHSLAIGWLEIHGGSADEDNRIAECDAV